LQNLIPVLTNSNSFAPNYPNEIAEFVAKNIVKQ